MGKLKECPFCGHTDLVTSDYGGLYTVNCRYCGAKGPELLTNESDAENAWNERPEVDMLEKEADWLAEKIEFVCNKTTACPLNDESAKDCSHCPFGTAKEWRNTARRTINPFANHNQR